MKQDKAAVILFTVLNAVLAVVCAVLFARTDRTAPEIEFRPSDAVYRENTNQEGLLTGISAYDSRDGDITDRVVIEKIIEDRDSRSAVVFYAASDRAGNVAKASRVFPAVYTDSGKNDGNMDRFLEAGIDAELSGSSSGGDSAEGKDGAGMTETSTPDSEESPSAAPTPEPEETPTPTPAPTTRPAPTVQPAPTPEPVRETRSAANASAPVLALKQTEVQVKAGEGPAWVNVIGTLKDDKDNYETLFKNLHVSRYDGSRAGTYQVTVYTEDSDGNRSEEVPLTIVVK